MMEVKKYNHRLGTVLDVISWALTYPWLSTLSLLVSFYWTTTYEKERPLIKAFQYGIVAPILFLLVISLLPFAITGHILWIVICYSFEKNDFATVCLEQSNGKKPVDQDSYTFVSGNLLLGLESMGKFQNMALVYTRAKHIMGSLNKLKENGPISNVKLLEDPCAENQDQLDCAVGDTWPQVDVMCFQEVWDRVFSIALMKAMYPRFKHFVVDVSHHSLNVQFCIGTSGLMIASRYPIMDANFHYFRHEKNSLWQKAICYGVVMAKLDLGYDSTKRKQRVGYVSNLHNVAYQGETNMIGPAMTELQTEFNAFRERTSREDEQVAFAVVCGDFNFDNISPGDSPMQDHVLFQQYSDYCMSGPGKDKSWAVGTEHRQLLMYEPELQSPEAMRAMMVDNVRRRHFIIDADIKEQTMDLMYCQPQPDKDGHVRAEPETGGRRRIDRILHDINCPAKPEGYQFLTCLAGHTDHVPVAMTLKMK